MDNFFKLEEKKGEEEGRMVHLEPLCSCFKIILHHQHSGPVCPPRRWSRGSRNGISAGCRVLIDERRERKATGRGKTDDTRSREFPTGGERGGGQTEMGVGDDDQNRDERGR